MSDGMGGWLTYLFSHTTYHYSIPNWGSILITVMRRGFEHGLHGFNE